MKKISRGKMNAVCEKSGDLLPPAFRFMRGATSLRRSLPDLPAKPGAA
jgi:hypothetical protein